MLNYFTLLDIPASFVIDDVALQRAYVQLQQQAHPDRMIGKGDAERAVAIQKSMDGNEAYEALKDPLKRARHLLALQGVFVNSEGQDTVKPSPALLMESMEIREQLEECADERDVALMVKDMREAMKGCEEKLAAAFTAESYEEAAQHTLRLRYLGKALEEAYMKQYQLKEGE